MPNDFAEGALFRQISAPLPKEPFCDHFTKTKVFLKACLGWFVRMNSNHWCFTASSALPSNPPLPMALWAGICQRKCLSHGKTLLVMLLGTHVQHRPIVTTQCLSLLSHNTDFGWQLGWKEEEKSLQGAAHSCRPSCRGKVLLYPQFREGSYRNVSGVTQGKERLDMCPERMDGVPLLFRYWISSLLNSSLLVMSA